MSLAFLRWCFVVMSMLAVASGAATYWLWSQNIPVPGERPLNAWEPPKRDAASAKFEDPDSADYSESFARPVFSPTRRPFVPQPDEPIPAPESEPALMPLPEATAPDISQIVLKGVRINGEDRQALILSATKSVAQWLSLGNQIEGFEVVDIAEDRVTLQSGQQNVEIKLYASKPEN